MSPNKFRLAFFLTTIGMLLLGQSIITQMTAYNLAYQYQLGKPLTVFMDIPIYNPLSFIFWYMDYYHYAKKTFDRGMLLCYLNVAIVLGFCFLINMWRYRQSQESETYGSARWANYQDILKAKLNAKYGIVLGVYPTFASRCGVLLKKYAILFPRLAKFFNKIISYLDPWVKVIRHDGPEHVLINAPSRSGKGVSVIVPTLLNWGSSVIVMDIKGENWALTSGFRSKFSYAICFNPTTMTSAKWNPLMEIRKGEREVSDVQNVADILVDPDGSGKTKSHWEKTGHALLVATILHVLYAEQDKTLSGVAQFLADPNRTILETLHYMMSTHHKDGKVHPVVSSAAREMLNKSENELSGVLSTAMSFLGLYRDPIVARNTSSCDFRIEDLMNADKPVSLYLVVPPSDISRLASLNRLMLNMILRRLTEKQIGAGGMPHKHRLLCLLDEFPSFGCMDFFKTSLGFLAGYGIKCMLICQSYNNIYELYGEKNSIFDNCHIRATMAPNDNKTANEISMSLGQKTVKRFQTNFTGRRLALWLSNISVASQESPRNLLNADEVQKLPEDQIIIMIAKTYPVLASKVFYFRDEPYISRCLKEVVLFEDVYPDKPAARENEWSEMFIQPEKLQTASIDLENNELELEMADSDADENKFAINITNDKLDNNSQYNLEAEDNDMDFETSNEVTVEREVLF